jgi:hypothetical protein
MFFSVSVMMSIMVMIIVIIIVIIFYFFNGRYIDCLSLTCATNKDKMLKLHYKYKREEKFKVNIRMIIEIVTVVVHAVYNILNQDIRTKLNENLIFTLQNF